MIGKPSARIPSYRLHKPKGLAVVRLDGRDIYLGKHGTAESQAEYRCAIAEWLVSRQGGGVMRGASASSKCATINELVLAYLHFARGYYVKNGEPTGEVQNLKDAVKPLVKSQGHVSVAEFGPLSMAAVREAMIQAGLSWSVDNRVNRIRRVFKWG